MALNSHMGLNQSEVKRIGFTRTGYYSIPKTSLRPIEEENEADLIEDEVPNSSQAKNNAVNKGKIQVTPKGRLIKLKIRDEAIKTIFKNTHKIAPLPPLISLDDTSPSSTSSKKSYGPGENSIDEFRRDRRVYGQELEKLRKRQIVFSSAKSKKENIKEEVKNKVGRARVVMINKEVSKGKQRLKKVPSCVIIRKPEVKGEIPRIRIRGRNSSVLNEKTESDNLDLVPLTELLKLSFSISKC